jgi:CheY-like chemotaxis protein
MFHLPEARATQATSELRSPKIGHGSRVLVVDDEPALLRAYVRWLESAGCTVEQASDGQAASALVADHRYDVIVSDIGMPGMDGVQLLRAVRERDHDVPVILMTGAPAAASAISAVEYGATRYLVKPFKELVLCDAVRHAVRLHTLAKLKREALVVVGGGHSQLGDLADLGPRFDRALATLWMAYQPIVRWSTKTVWRCCARPSRRYRIPARCSRQPSGWGASTTSDA